ncbi:hypothetical protein V6N13_147372 [Hibiscus sabdariffa]|uniref:Uncharacterized protein n=1 Tax=Hibiscus sabdariffa TaxID=183260 RepID=A0ABR2TW58_9ROSI
MANVHRYKPVPPPVPPSAPPAVPVPPAPPAANFPRVPTAGIVLPKVLVEVNGNLLDGSSVSDKESVSSYNPRKRKFYFEEPACSTMPAKKRSKRTVSFLLFLYGCIT